MADSHIKKESSKAKPDKRSRSKTPNNVDEQILRDVLAKSAKARDAQNEGVLLFQKMSCISIESEKRKTSWLDKIEVPLPSILMPDYARIMK